MKYRKTSRFLPVLTAILAGMLLVSSCGGTNTESRTTEKPAESKAPASSIREKEVSFSDSESSGDEGKDNPYENYKYSKQISVQATSDKTVVPDIANLSIGVTTTDKDAQKCYTGNTRKVNDTIAAIKALGITDDQIKTADISLQEQYRWDEKSSRQVSDGYMMSSTVTVSGIEIAKVGDVLSAGISSGTNEIRSLTYESSKYDDTYAAALKEATESARKKADMMAEAGGSKVVDLVSVSEQNEDTSSRYVAEDIGTYATKSAEINAAPTAPAITASPGTIKIHAGVNAVFRIDQ